MKVLVSVLIALFGAALALFCALLGGVGGFALAQWLESQRPSRGYRPYRPGTVPPRVSQDAPT